MRYWRIDWHYIDDDGILKTIPMQLCKTIDSAIECYSSYVRMMGTGWYDLVELYEKVISL